MAIETAYRGKIKGILKGLTDNVIEVVKNPELYAYTSDGIGEIIGRRLSAMMERLAGAAFSQFVERIARAFVDDQVKFSDRTMSEIAPSVGLNVYNTPRLREVTELATQQNAQLIKSIASQHLTAISNIVFDNVMKGLRPSEIEAEIKAYGVTAARAKLIARDQTAKVVSSISKARMLDAGFKYFKWDTAHDQRVRDSHRAAQNRVTKYGVGVYRWDDLPEVDGEKTSPGMPIQCRCVALPVLEFEVEEFQREHK